MDSYEAVRALPDLKTCIWKTPSAGATAKPFRVDRVTSEAIEVKTSMGGRVSLRPEAFEAGVKALADLGANDGEGWVLVSDDVLSAVLSSENREKACTSYVLPLLEAAGLIEIARARPAKARVARPRGGARE